mmetsp:Transcript_39361/g.75459  ORF Transcript_39361/g.75459 Transcript_39361/m.75459 type:complete len:237 (-) Transcript_39361:77-787(-)
MPGLPELYYVRCAIPLHHPQKASGMRAPFTSGSHIALTPTQSTEIVPSLVAMMFRAPITTASAPTTWRECDGPSSPAAGMRKSPTITSSASRNSTVPSASNILKWLSVTVMLLPFLPHTKLRPPMEPSSRFAYTTLARVRAMPLLMPTAHVTFPLVKRSTGIAPLSGRCTCIPSPKKRKPPLTATTVPLGEGGGLRTRMSKQLPVEHNTAREHTSCHDNPISPPAAAPDMQALMHA